MNTNDKGNLSVAKVISALTEKGINVSIPIGEGLPYDLILEEDGKLYRCQVKTARWKNGCVVFDAKSNNGRWMDSPEKTRNYIGKADVFCAYSPHLNKCYWVLVKNQKASISLRVNESKCYNSRIKWAKDYEI